MSNKARAALAAIALVVSMAFGGTGGALASVQLGAHAPGTEPLPAGTTAMQNGGEAKSAPEPYRYAGPPASQGVITSWSTYNSGGTYGLKLKVGNAFGTDGGIARYESALETVSATGTNTFPSRIRIFNGESIGVYSSGGAPGMLQTVADVPSLYVVLKAGDLLASPGTLTATPDTSGWEPSANIYKSAFRLNIAATVELDADGDLFGDETQDKCPGVNGSADGCVPPPPPPLKCKKGFKKTLTAKGKLVCKKAESKKKGKCKKAKGKGSKSRASASKKKGKGKKRCGGKQGKGKKKGNGRSG